MATSFAAQLSRIAATSSHELDLRARRTLHAESLLFPRDVAAKQDFDNIYAICLQGFRDLCQLDSRFNDFDRNLFSPQAKEQDRDQMNRGENEALDSVIDRFLSLLGGRILLNPAVRALEWLVRRFRAHVHNTSGLLLMLLPYHDMPIWRNVISIVPENKLVADWKWAAPYKGDSLNVPRHAIAHAFTNNDGFWAKFNTYIIDTAREGYQHGTLLQFWNAIVVEAVVGRLSAARSGRKEIQRERTQDALLKILPVLSEGFEIKDCPDFTTALLTLAMILAAKAELDDRVLDSLVQTISTFVTPNGLQSRSAIIATAVLITQKQSRTLPRQTVDAFRMLPQLEENLQTVAKSYPITALIEGLAAGVLSSISRKKRNSQSKISFLEKVVRYCVATDDRAALKALFTKLLGRILQPTGEDHGDSDLRSALVGIVRRFNEEDTSSQILVEAAKDLGQSQEDIEILIGDAIAMIDASAITNDNMDLDVEPSRNPTLEELLASAPSRTADVSSFLAEHGNLLFEQLFKCFEICCQNESDIRRFSALPIWSSATSGQLLLFSFWLRVGTGPYSTTSRIVAITLLARSIATAQGIDMQAVVPYALAALCDASASIRQAASEVLIAIAKVSSSDDISEQFGKSELYTRVIADQIAWIPTSHIAAILHQALIPSIEECVLDASEAERIIEFAMNGNPQTESEGIKLSRVELKKSVRQSFLEFLTSHAIATPVLRVKLALISLLKNVQKVGNTTKTNALMPILLEWVSHDEVKANTIAQLEKMNLENIDKAMVEVISAPQKVPVNDLLDLLEQNAQVVRPGFVAASFAQIQNLWVGTKHDIQASSALKLFELSFADVTSISGGARGVLQSVHLSTDALGAIVEQSLLGITQMQADQQPKKRRRTSHGRENLPPDLAKVVDAATSRLTLSLELVDSTGVEKRPGLLPTLFDVLAMLKRLKQQQRLQSPYLLNLCLGNIHGIVQEQADSPKPNIDLACIRADLVTECIRTSESPQVQNTALLLSASLASLAPDRMLHSVMPIFTFMGQNVFSKEDDHSIFVIYQAINQIIPVLVDSLKKQNKDMIKSTSGLLSTFAAAFDHIPQHRRVSIYHQLLGNMSSDDFAFVLVAMLAVRNELSHSFMTFLADLMAELPVLTQFVTYQKLLLLASDVESTLPRMATDIFNFSGSTPHHEKERIQVIILETALRISKLKSLTTVMSRLHKVDSETRGFLRQGVTAAVQQILSIIRDGRNTKRDVEIAKQCLDALLALPPLFELFSLIPTILDGMENEQDLKSQTLRVLASQLESNRSHNTRTRAAGIELLALLTRMLHSEEDHALTQAMIVAIDRLTELYGRQDPGTVLNAVTAMSSEACLGSANRRVQTMSLLCLASTLEVLRENCAPVISALVTKTVQKIESTIESPDDEVYAAVNALAAAIVSHASFLLSDDDIQQLIVSSIGAASVFSAKQSTDSRSETLGIIARKADLSAVVNALQTIVSSSDAESRTDIGSESLDLLSNAIEMATKAHVIKNADSISQLLLAYLDIRRLSTAKFDADLDFSSIENKIDTVSIQYIYKLNDTIFRPTFETWIDWSTKAYDISSDPDFDSARQLRQVALFQLLIHFFSTLKSIVTSYAGYVIAPASTVLDSMANNFEIEKRATINHTHLSLYKSTLEVLRSMFSHDADGFFAMPSHFDPLGPSLVRQLSLVSSKGYRDLVYTQVIPTIVLLATAVTDTPVHHQTISHHLTALRRSPSAAIRLASIRTLAALSADEDVGDDFIANTIGVGSAAVTDGDGAGIARGGGSSAGELMIYVNEMLEDDDEEVEMEVRKWVQSVREKVGEDVFEV